MEELTLSAKVCFAPSTMVAFRRFLRQRYGTLQTLNAAWNRDYETWTDVRPDDLETAIARGTLVSWAQHRAFMESQIAGWQEKTERMFRETVPDGVVGMTAAAVSSPDGGSD